MPRWQSFALSIDKRDFRETSQLVQFLTEEHGMVACLARGAYREKNAYEGPIDLLVYCRITVVAGRGGGGLELLTRREVLTNFPEIREDLARYRAAMYLLWLVREGVREGQTIQGLFALVRAAFVALNDRPVTELTAIVFAFEWRLLRMLGMDPQVTACVACGRGGGSGASPPEAVRGQPGEIVRHRDGEHAGGLGRRPSGWTLSGARGGLLCPRCRQGEPPARGLSRAALETIRRLDRTPAVRLAADPDFRSITGELRQLLDAYWSYRLERPVAGAPWLADLVPRT